MISRDENINDELQLSRQRRRQRRRRILHPIPRTPDPTSRTADPIPQTLWRTLCDVISYDAIFRDVISCDVILP